MLAKRVPGEVEMKNRYAALSDNIIDDEGQPKQTSITVADFMKPKTTRRRKGKNKSSTQTSKLANQDVNISYAIET